MIDFDPALLETDLSNGDKIIATVKEAASRLLQLLP